MSTVSMVTPLSRPCTWDHTASVSSVNSSQTLYLGSYVHSIQADPISLNLYLGSHFHSIQGDSTSRACTWCHMSSVSRENPPPRHYLGSNVHSLQSNPISLTLYLGSYVHSIQGDSTSRACTWCHMSSVSRQNPPLRYCIRVKHPQSPG